eukprot:jgi/Tetstr1/436846/TSEL_025623.t1
MPTGRTTLAYMLELAVEGEADGHRLERPQGSRRVGAPGGRKEGEGRERGRRRGRSRAREQHWWIKATLKYKWVVYFLIALHITWRMWVAISSLPVHRAQLAREVGGNSMWDGANASTMSGMARSGDAFDEL